MHLRIFTLPFDPVLEGFPDEIVSEFCLNKRVHKLDAHFSVYGTHALRKNIFQPAERCRL